MARGRCLSGAMTQNACRSSSMRAQSTAGAEAGVCTCAKPAQAARIARELGISREEQDAYSLQCQRKTLAARADGRLAAEIAPIDDVTADGCPRETDAEKLAGLKTAFKAGGSVTAGNSSPLTDGASAALVCSEDFVKRHNLTPLARISGYAIAGCAPEIMGIGPVAASKKAL